MKRVRLALARRAGFAFLPLAILFSKSSALACSGPGAPAAMARATLVGWVLWLATFAVLGGFALSPRLRAHGWRKQAPFGWIVLLHPGWWLPTNGGDCGVGRVEFSFGATIVAIVVAVVIYMRAGRAPREPFG